MKISHTVIMEGQICYLEPYHIPEEWNDVGFARSDYAKVGLSLNLAKRLTRVKDIRDHTEGMERKEKEPDEEGKAREAGVLNCIKWSTGNI